MPAEFTATINGIEVKSFDEGVNVLRDIQTAVKRDNREGFLEEMRARKEADKAAREQAPGLPEGAEGGPPAEPATGAGDATI